MVLLNRVQRDIRITAVACDNYGGGRDVGQRLLERGSRRIGFIGGIANTSTHAERARGIRDALAEGGAAIHAQAGGNFNYPDAYAAAVTLLSAADRPDAVFCCNDIMALAMVDAARERGMSVPDDVAVVGFDDIPMASWTSYRLTTIRQPVERMVREALDLIDGPTLEPSDDGVTRMLPGRLVPRATA